MKNLLGVLIVAMFVLTSCATKEVMVVKEEVAEKSAEMVQEKKDHACSEDCMTGLVAAHMEKMGADHVCTDECMVEIKAAHKAMHTKAHECSDECKAKHMAAHMEKMGADHVCTDDCKIGCEMKAEKAECVDTDGEEAPAAMEEGTE